MSYYYIEQYYNDGMAPRLSGHVIRARDEHRAFMIITKHKDSFTGPLKNRKVRQYTIRKASEGQLKRRRKGIHGRIWYEEKGELKSEPIVKIDSKPKTPPSDQ